MVRENRIKQYIFPSFTATGSEQSATFSDHSINGEILKIRVEGIATPGSIWLAESGANIEFFRKNDFASGNVTAEFYPFVYSVDSTNTTGSPNIGTQMVTNSELYYAGSGLTSGNSMGPITVFYR